MSDVNDTALEIYQQLIKFEGCLDALRDVCESIPEGEKLYSLLPMVSDNLRGEFSVLNTLVFNQLRDIKLE